MIQNLLNSLVTIKRAAATSSASRDALNNPVYGLPTTWATVYTNVPVRLAFSANEMIFAHTGERVTPAGVMYYNPQYELQQNDRVVTADGIEYVVTSIAIGYSFGTTIDHYEANLILP